MKTENISPLSYMFFQYTKPLNLDLPNQLDFRILKEREEEIKETIND
jgi:hypothetical protein